MSQFTTLVSSVIPLPVDNIDTDQIIPARFLKVTDKEGLGKVLFCDWRYQDFVSTIESAEDAQPDPEFALNFDHCQAAQILVAGDNFGCGSSREHAPWALKAKGISAIISTSFADIFRNNALKNGLLPIEVDTETHETLLEMIEEIPHLNLTIDLEAQTLRLPDGSEVIFPIDPFAKKCMLQGVDQLGYLLALESSIEAYEEHDRV